MGVFEDYTEQPVLSLTIVEETTAPLVITKTRGKRRAEVQESSNSELLSLLTEMKKEMRRRDEQLRDELRWRDDNQAA